MSFVKVDDIIDGIMQYGRGTLMAKFDIESAYCNIPVHSDDWSLLGIKRWREYFIDLALPFGLRSALFIVSSTADLLDWILKQNYYGPNFLLHYLDDSTLWDLLTGLFARTILTYLCAPVWGIGYPPSSRQIVGALYLYGCTWD